MGKIHPSLPTQPPIKEATKYSKPGLIAIFLAALPFLILWTAAIVLSFPLKVWNWIQSTYAKKQIHWVNSLYHEYTSFFCLTARYPCSKKYHFTPGNGTPILLIHGYLHNASGWYKFIERLQAKGLGPIYALDLGDGSLNGKFWSIDRYVKQALQKTETIAAKTGHAVKVIIGHSMGGLIAIETAQQMPPGTVTDVITLGSPLQGASLAGLIGIGPSARDMAPGSKLLKTVGAGIQTTSDRVRYRHVASKGDRLVSPKSALRGNLAEDNALFDDLGHAGLLLSNRVAQKVCNWIADSKTSS